MLENLEPASEVWIPFAIPVPGAIIIPIIILAGRNIDIREFFVLPRIHDPDDFKKRSMALVRNALEAICPDQRRFDSARLLHRFQ